MSAMEIDLGLVKHVFSCAVLGILQLLIPLIRYVQLCVCEKRDNQSDPIRRADYW